MENDKEKDKRPKKLTAEGEAKFLAEIVENSHRHIEVTNMLSKFVVKTKEGHVDVRVHFRTADGALKVTRRVALEPPILAEILKIINSARQTLLNKSKRR